MGRRRVFDTEKALDAALGVFWAKGFEGASYADLTAATGVARPGLYAAFGNKEEMFLKALDRYDQIFMGFFPAALREARSVDVARRALRGAAEVHTGACTPAGCLGINGALACSDDAESIRVRLADRRRGAEAVLAERFVRAKDDGDLRDDADPAALARFVMTLSQGMSVQAKAGATREQLLEVVELALAGWPSETR
ncbi:TetR/AcrR family transcriptional regulator [Methylopila sp. Yamaguchi]|uniref:TetR/AcrR family transcriptional regulator n=1 Tax=Methylopila sp. Yamaguchi TaxID=1437817 RepID=UPI000CC505F8|nr:TetR/AcrR family transcriptional regulator [Methylopila sp. Yamaguchi]GBD48845.1 TetR family transcriptional regulator [Methylopila sp. Yamaguchi]